MAAPLDPSRVWMLLGFLAVTALVAFYLSFRYWYRARLIEDVPTARIRSAPQGYVELEGTGQPLETAPLISASSTRRGQRSPIPRGWCGTEPPPGR